MRRDGWGPGPNRPASLPIAREDSNGSKRCNKSIDLTPYSAALNDDHPLFAGLSVSHEELAAFFRGLHPGALATGRQLAASSGFDRFRSLLDVGGGSGGVAIAACERASIVAARKTR